MKIVLDFSTNQKAFKPSKDDIILFDGAKWYVTSKKIIMEEYEKNFENKLKECDDKMNECNLKIAEMEQFKKDVSKQLLDFSTILSEFINLKEN